MDQGGAIVDKRRQSFTKPVGEDEAAAMSAAHKKILPKPDSNMRQTLPAGAVPPPVKPGPGRPRGSRYQPPGPKPPSTYVPAQKIAPNPSVRYPDQVWNKSTYRIFDLVWVPVMLVCKEQRNLITLSNAKTMNVASIKEDFVYWPAIVQNIFKAPYRELWYGPLCIEEVQEKKFQVISTQIFKNIRETNIEFAYSVTLINLNMATEVVLAESEIRPYLNWRPPIDWLFHTEQDVARVCGATSDGLIGILFTALRLAQERASRIQPLSNSEVAPPSAPIKPDEIEINGVIFGPEVLKVNDVLRVKVKNSDASAEEFKLMHFRICTMITNKNSRELIIHGKRLHIDPALRKEDGSFMLLVDDLIWSSYSEICAMKSVNERGEKRILCMFQTTTDTLYQIQPDRILGRFYDSMPEMHLDARIEIKGISKA